MFEEIRISDLTQAFIVNSGDLFVIEQANGTKALTYSLLKTSIAQEISSGKAIELNNNGSFLQWRYVGDLLWKNLLNLDELKGPPGESIVWKGTWLDNVSYKLLEAVTYNGSSYVCVNAVGNAGRDPSLLSSRPYWGILGQRGVDGPAGSPGATGAAGAPGASIVWKGAYSDSAAYFKLDAVSYNGNSYICSTTGTGSITNVLPTSDSTKWSLMVSKGETGYAGAGISWKGTYASNTEYSNLNAVFFNGQSYICKSTTTITGVSPTETTKWDVLVLKGDAGPAGADGARTFAVSAITDNFVIDGSNDPALNLLRGFTYKFSLNIGSSHAFWIQTSSGAYNAANVYSSGVTNNGGTGVSSITFAVPYNAPSTLYYVCGQHSTMGGTINITDVGPQGLPGNNALWSYKGAYASQTVYAVGDVVTHNGSTWYRKLVGAAGTAPSADSTYWDLLAAKGTDGATGGGASTTEVGGVTWSSTATYSQGALVTTATRDSIWISIQDLNTNHEPTTSPLWWKPAAADAVSLQLKGVSTTAPTNGQILSFNSTSDKWEPINNTGGSGSTVLWNYLGAYDALKVYAVGDLVTNNGSLWYRKLVGAAGTAPALDSTYWDVLALKGTDGTGGGTGADFLYSSKIDNNVTSNPLGGAAAALASVWKTRTIVDVLDLLLFPTQLPTYTVPVLTISGTQSGTREVGVGITQVLTLTGIKNDAGAFTTLTLKRGSTTISTSSSLSAIGATAVAEQFGYANPNNPNYSYTITYSDTLNVPYSTLSWSGTSVYGIGLVKQDNKNASDTRTFAVRSTSAPQSAASDLTTNSLSVTGIYPYFWGKVAATSGKPTAAQIAGFIQAGAPGTSNKVLADASGTITITFDASSEYVWVAHEASLTNKTKWYNTANNLGNIGAGNFIESPVQQNVTSPQGYWTAVSFDIYISGAATNTSGSYQLQN